MKIGILGTGMVGRAHASRLAALGHQVMIGTGDIVKTLGRTEPDEMGTPAFSEWRLQNENIILGVFADTAMFGEMVFNCIKGEFAVEVLEELSKELYGKILVDISNPLDFSQGMPPTLLIGNTDSLGEQIQFALPNVKVVKAFNTVNAFLQVNPIWLLSGNHTLFVAWDNPQAKSEVIQIALNYGWIDIIDLGDMTWARGMEMWLPLWLRLWWTIGSPMFNLKIVR
ncbi:MAG: hypothetical protein ACD_2C00122G0008 [uncultured bacterium (gcode 4)]|uniref:Pyrroline-5-carboxylate reductase catalytic N-terminal domain-containing protein n=1 Tax=uncultured bacterium (gcode 4) TaxID=1234023 RepID=K2FER5_9BACT|nr:MAG: hypothetical protein ACD_2C00122G0008 [uncultured bacterium (gcode 4)]